MGAGETRRPAVTAPNHDGPEETLVSDRPQDIDRRKPIDSQKPGAPVGRKQARVPGPGAAEPWVRTPEEIGNSGDRSVPAPRAPDPPTMKLEAPVSPAPPASQAPQAIRVISSTPLFRHSSPARQWLFEQAEDASEWCTRKQWIWRAPLLLYLVIGGFRHMSDSEYSTFLFGGVTFGIHELGHVALGWAGRFLAIAGGSLAQVAAPVASIFIFRRQRDYFGIAVAGAWLGFSLWNLATYIGDARNMDLSLLGLGSDPEHDWNRLLSMTGLLRFDHVLAFLTRGVAFVSWGAACGFGAWLLVRMAKGGKKRGA